MSTWQSAGGSALHPYLRFWRATEILSIRLEGIGVDNGGGGLYPKKVIADLLNLTERRVEQLTKLKILPKAERGKYDLGPTVKAYVMYLQQRLSGGDEVIDVKALKDEKLKAETDERKAKARIAEMRQKTLEGSLIERDQVIKEWTGRVIEVKAALLGLPQEIGFLFAEEKFRSTVEEGVESFVNETLKRYSRDGICTPRAGTDENTVEQRGTECAAAAAKDKRQPMGGRKQSAKQQKQRNARSVEDKPDAVSP